MSTGDGPYFTCQHCRARYPQGTVHFCPSTVKSVVIPGYYSPSFLRSPYADSRKAVRTPIHAVARNRSGNQSKRFAAPKTRYLRTNQAAETRDSTRATYDHLPWRAT